MRGIINEGEHQSHQWLDLMFGGGEQQREEKRNSRIVDSVWVAALNGQFSSNCPPRSPVQVLRPFAG